MKATLVILNLVASVLVIAATWLISQTQTLGVSKAYTDLDRAGVIDRQKLADSFPDLAANDRYAFAQRALPGRPVLRNIGIPCAAVFALNAVLIGVFTKPRARPAPST